MTEQEELEKILEDHRWHFREKLACTCGEALLKSTASRTPTMEDFRTHLAKVILKALGREPVPEKKLPKTVVAGPFPPVHEKIWTAIWDREQEW